MNRTRILAMLAPVLLFLTACGVNSIPTAEENAKAKWADVQNYYQRRADLIPNLVATVRAAADAGARRADARSPRRGRAPAGSRSAPSSSPIPPRWRASPRPRRRLTLSLQRLQEAYPELRTNENFLDPESQLEGTENRISIARRDYNAAVQAYNTEIRTFPSMHRRRGSSTAASRWCLTRPTRPPSARPTVNFGNSQ